MNKTLWIIDHYSSEPKYGGYTRQYNLAKGMAENGINVVVISSSFSHFTHSYISDKDILINKVSEKVRFVYLKTIGYSSNTSIRRFLGMISFICKIKTNYRKLVEIFGKPKWVVASSPHIFNWWIGRKIASKAGADFNIEIRDFWPLELRTKNDSFARKLLFLYFDKVETKSFECAKKIICTLPYGYKYCDDYKKNGRNKFVYIGHPIDCDSYDRCAAENWNMLPDVIRDFVKDSFYCVFSGYYMQYEGVYYMLEAAEKIPSAKFVFVGSGDEEQRMKKYVLEHKLKNVLIYQRIRKEAVPALLSNSNVCMAYLHDNNNPDMYKYGMSKNKINEYLYSGAVTVMGVEMQENEILDSGGGFTFGIKNNEFPNIINKVIKMDRLDREAIGERGRLYIKEKHNIRALSDIYIREILGIK